MAKTMVAKWNFKADVLARFRQVEKTGGFSETTEPGYFAEVDLHMSQVGHRRQDRVVWRKV